MVKVKVHKITQPLEKTATKSLQSVLRNHAYDRLHFHIGTKELCDITEELARRQQETGIQRRTNQEAWEDFVDHYFPIKPSEEKTLQTLLTPHMLTPSFYGAECLGNGNWIGYECQCDECPYFLICFPGTASVP